MSQENVRIVERVLRASSSEEIDAVVALHHPDWEGFVPREFPMAGSWRGRDGLRRFYADWFEAFEEFHVEPEEFIDGDDAVVVTVRYRGRGRGSGIVVTDHWVYAYRLREGLISAWRPYRDRAQALEALGLEG
jgi:ketosteroid isomerase-like protein